MTVAVSDPSISSWPLLFPPYLARSISLRSTLECKRARGMRARNTLHLVTAVSRIVLVWAKVFFFRIVINTRRPWQGLPTKYRNTLTIFRHAYFRLFLQHSHDLLRIQCRYLPHRFHWWWINFEWSDAMDRVDTDSIVVRCRVDKLNVDSIDYIIRSNYALDIVVE